MSKRARGSLAPALVLFSIMVAHALLETARDTLFLVRLGPDDLAWVYMAMAGVAFLAFFALGKRGRSGHARRLLLVLLGVASIGTGVLAVSLQVSSSVVFALYIWAGLVATMVVPMFWTVIDHGMHVIDAKRMFATIGTGGVLGATVGSGLAALLARVMPAAHLVTVAAGGYAIATATAFALLPKRENAAALEDADPATSLTMSATGTGSASASRPASASGSTTAASATVEHRYLYVLVALGITSTIALTLGDLVFKRALAEHVPADQLAAAFGIIYAGLNVVGLAVQVLVTPRLLSRWGVGGALVVLPLIMAASSFSFAATGAVLAIVALKLGDGSLRYSLHRVGTEILFLPVPSDLRDRSKPIIDAIGLRGGQAAAAVLALVLVRAGATSRTAAAVSAGVAAVWLVGAVAARRAYIDAFRDALRHHDATRRRRKPQARGEAFVQLLDLLASPDEAEALAALDVLAWRHQVPVLALYHPNHRIVRHALLQIGDPRRPAVARVLAQLRSHPDPEVRAAALSTASRAGVDRARLRAALQDPDEEVRAVAMVELTAAAAGGASIETGIAQLIEGSEADRIAFAQAIALDPVPSFAPYLNALVDRKEPRVSRIVLQLWARVPALSDGRRSLELLGDPHVRGDARRALAALGEPGLALAIAAFDDPATRLALRRQLPRAIVEFAGPTAMAALTSRLLPEPDGTTEFKILRALGRLRDQAPELPFDRRVLEIYTERSVTAAARYATFCDLAAGSGDHPADRALRTILDEKRQSAIERAFRALGVLDPDGEVRSLYEAATGRDEIRRSASIEVLEATIPSGIRRPLLATLMPIEPDERRRELGDLAPGPYEDDVAFTAALLADPSESVRCIAAFHAGEHQIRALRAQMEQLPSTAKSSLTRSAFEQAVARLDAGV